MAVAHPDHQHASGVSRGCHGRRRRSLEDEAVEGEEGEEGAPKSKKLLFIIIAVVLRGRWRGRVLLPEGRRRKNRDAKKEAVVLPPIYVNLDPPFVVNFEAEAAVRFLQVTVSVMTREPHVEELLKKNDPRIRNDLLMLPERSEVRHDLDARRQGKAADRSRSNPCAPSSRTPAVSPRRSRPCTSPPS